MTWSEHLHELRMEFLGAMVMYNGTAYDVEDVDTNGCIHIQMDGVNGTLYPVSLSLNPGIPDALCNSIEIDGTIYRFISH